MQEFNDKLEKVLKIILQYLKENEDLSTPVLEYRKATDLKEALGLSIPHAGCSFEDLLQEMKSYLQFSVRTGHQHFLNQLYSGITWPALVGEILTTLTNTSMSTFEVSPVGTLLEQTLIQKMNSLLGFDQGEGLFVTGGSNANLVAMLCARNILFPQIKEDGVGARKLLLFVSEEAHYSYQKGANCLGLGTKQVMQVATDSRGRMIPQELESKILAGIKSGGVPFFIGATAGTTVAGAFDPFGELHQIAKKYKLWLHVDGAFGSALLLSPQYRHYLKGCELVDSVSWDAHKVMGIPLICSAILLREKGGLFKAQSGGGGEYLFHEYENEEFDLGPLSLQCGRRVDSLKLWLSWKYYGDQGYAQRIDHLIDLAKFAENFVQGHPKLHLMIPRESFNICFQYRHPDTNKDQDWNALNIKLRQKLVTAGKIMINYSKWKGQVVIRAVFLNPALETQEIISILTEVVRIGDELIT